MNRALIVFTCIWMTIPLFSQPSIALEQVTTGFFSPVSIASAGDDSDRLFIVERSGIIKIYDFREKSIISRSFLDIRSRVESGGERGLLGLDFHPNYPDSPYCYVNYTFRESGQLKTKVERYTTSNDPDSIDVQSDVQILEVNQPFTNHNAGDMKFGPDGFLYVTMGDGGSGFDPGNRSQDTTDLLGSLLRIDINGDDFPADPDFNYAIPPDNPFINDPTTLNEFWAIGLRNPWRISFDRTTGDLYIADVGQGDLEEVNFQTSGDSGGQNYGWSCKEGTIVQNFNPCIAGQLTDPIFEYGRSEGYSITGGFVYRGSMFPSLFGYYIVADYGSGNFWLINSGDFSEVHQIFLQDDVTSFGESDSGELYAVTIGGSLYRIFDADFCEESIEITDHLDSMYNTNVMIDSDVPVLSTQDVTYRSPAINLNNPFSVETMGLFIAESRSCIQYIIEERY